MLKIRIIFPPQFEPYQPYLSLPYLKGLLSKLSIESTYYDANIDFYWWIFSNKKEFINNTNENNKLKYLFENIDIAVGNLKKKGIDIFEYRWSMNIVEEFLLAISPQNFEISLNYLNIGNKYSSASLKSLVIDKTSIFDLFFQDKKQKILGDKEYNYYFFSIVVIDQLGPSLSIAKNIKHCRPNSKIVFGGAFIARINEKLKKIGWINDIVDEIRPEEGNIAVSKILGLESLYNGHVSPIYDELESEKYLSSEFVVPYLIAHGCKWGKCIFCSHHISYNSYRTSSFSDVIIDIEKIKDKFGTRFISFCDEYIPIPVIKDLSNGLKEKNLQIYWSSFSRAEKEYTEISTTNDIYAAGGRVLFYGFETVSQRLLNLMKKGNNSLFYEDILKNCKSSNIAVRIDLMVDFPTETNEEFGKLIKFLSDNIETLDTPFSSYSAAVFELKEDTPIIKQTKKLKLNVKSTLRGDLDEQLQFNSEKPEGINKLEKRKRVIMFYKTKLKAELISPKNKTHQLIFKAEYDNGEMQIPSYPVMNFENKIKLNKGVIFKSKTTELENLSNGGSIKLAKHLSRLGTEIVEYKSIETIQNILNISDKQLFLSLINYLVRNDYIVIDEKSNSNLY